MTGSILITFLIDIDECKEPGIYRCEGKCKNKIGDYECECPLGCQGFRVTAMASGISTITCTHFHSLQI